MSADVIAVLDANLHCLAEQARQEAEATLRAGLSVASMRDGVLILETMLPGGEIETRRLSPVELPG